MRISIILFITINIMTYVAAQDNLDEKYGFRNIKLEASFNEFEELKLIKEIHGMTYYIKEFEDLKENNLEFQQIIYGFYNNRLYFIILRTIGSVNAQSLLQYLNQEYGEGQANHNIADSYTWFAKKAGLVYEYKEIPETAEAYLYSKVLLIEKRKTGK